MKKLFTFLLAVILLFSCTLVGCTVTPEDDSSSTTTSADETTTAEETTAPPPQGPLTLTSVSITTGESAAEVYAGSELQKYLEKKGVTVSADGFPITIKIDSTLAEDGYRVSADLAKEMTIAGGNGRGVLYGVYGFLEEYADCRFFMPDLERCEKGDVVIDHGVLCDYTPVFELRRMNWHTLGTSADWCVKNGSNISNATFGEEMGGGLSYGAWFVHTLGKLTETGGDNPAYAANPCLTDPDILKTAIANVRKALQEDPNINILSVSQNDSTAYCKCANCAAIDAEEGSPAGTLLRFVNAIAADIAEDYPNVTIDTLAYKYTQKAPSVTKPLPNVCVRLCSISCDFTHPLHCEDNCTDNETFCNDLIEWGKICDNIYIWDYTTNFHYYIATYANLHVLRENMRFYAENNVKGMFPQGNSNSLSGEFGELRAYLLAKLMMDPYMTEEEYYTHMDEFLEAYYGEGWTYLRTYIDEICEMASFGCQGIYDYPFTAISEVNFRAKEKDFTTYWEKAEELAGDRVAYVKRSRLQWRYILLMLHPGVEDAQALIADVTADHIAWKENMWTARSTSDLAQPPHQWYYSR